MKYTALWILIICLPVCVNGQDSTPYSNDITPPSFVAGIQADVHIAVTYAYTGDNGLNLLAGGGLIFARKYFGKHFAVQLDAGKGFSEMTFYEPDLYVAGVTQGPIQTHTYSYKMSSFDIPVNFQFHMGKRSSNLRPYAGVGIGVASMTSYSTITHMHETYKETRTGALLQVTEGITYRLNSKLLFEQSMYYKIVQDIGNHRVGIRFGLGYTIM